MDAVVPFSRACTVGVAAEHHARPRAHGSHHIGCWAHPEADDEDALCIGASTLHRDLHVYRRQEPAKD
jgi:hypothetical protein